MRGGQLAASRLARLLILTFPVYPAAVFTGPVRRARWRESELGDRAFYLNTDLDIVSAEDLTPLAAYLAARKWSVLHAGWHPDGFWLGIFEARHGAERTPELAIGSMLRVLEALPASLRQGWDACSKRDFNIGYESGTAGPALEQTLSTGLLARIARAGASVSVTIHPPHEPPSDREG